MVLVAAAASAGCPDFGSPRARPSDGGAADAGGDAGGDAEVDGGPAADADAGDGGGGCPETPVTVTMSYMTFQPEHVTVRAGCPVVWLNRDGTVIHTVTSGAPEGPDGRFDSGELRSGETFEHRFEAAGVYRYFCRTHPTTMRDATVMVE